jgi:DNA-binding FadR family transcriptional regulator
MMRRLQAFCGVRVLTYTLMPSHFHLLCEVPQARELSDAELLDRIQAGFLKADLDFHRAIYAAARNKLIVLVAEFVLNIMDPWVCKSLEVSGRYKQ